MAPARKLQDKRVKLRPADPFELIRWLARSQSDPRKAVAELVQNSLDAGARQVVVVRRRLKGAVSVTVADDGRGVLPERDRSDALQHLATHVGHSHKRGLSPQQRAEQVVAGQYGVGLLGFWAIGKQLELRTRVAGSELWALRLTEDAPDASIVRLPLPREARDTFTEAVVTAVHESAVRVLTGRRLSDYLAAELRGQLLQRDVELIVEDRLSRSPASRRITVEPRQFVGEQLAVPRLLPVPGHGQASVQLYFADDGGRIQLACAGTLVAEDIGTLSMLGLDTSPWTGRGLTGMVDFAGFSVPPGTRRGVVPNQAADAFVEAMAGLAPVVEAELERRSEERAAAKDRQVVRELRRALRGFNRRLPQYTFPGSAEQPGQLSRVGAAGADADADETVAAGGVSSEPLPCDPDDVELAPLDAVTLRPRRLELAPGAERKVRAYPKDAAGRAIATGVTFAWSTAGPLRLAGDGRAPSVVALATAVPGQRGAVFLDAVAHGHVAQAELEVEIVEPEDKDDLALGIADPELCRDPGAPWRSRLSKGTWQINEAHEDYVAVRGDPRARLRYLLALLAKEMVLRAYGRPGDDVLLEHLVEVLAHAERNLRGR